MTRPAVRDDLRALEGYHSPQVVADVRLNTNESPFPPPAGFADALSAELSRIDWHRYPDRGATELRRAIGEWHGVTERHILAANGSNEVLQLLLLAFAGAGRNVATFEPTYQMHAQIARVTGARVVSALRRPDFTLDLAASTDLIRAERPAVTFICSPNNPTGLVEPRGNVEALLEAVASVDGLLVVDEAYAQFAPWTALDLLGDEVPLAVTRTFSKTWSMAAARLGYVVGPTWLIDVLDAVVLPYHLDAAKQAAGRVALRFVDEMSHRVGAIVDQRERLCDEFARLGVQYVPSGANFVLFRTGAHTASEVWSALLSRGVLVRDCSSWPYLDACLRVTVGTAEENTRFVAALEEVLS